MKKQNIADENNVFSFFLIFLPIRNEAADIEYGLRAILDQDYPASCIGIMITDGISTDNTRNIIFDFAALPPQIHILDNPGKIVPTSMNIALRRSAELALYCAQL